jgi:hypothetical protein
MPASERYRADDPQGDDPRLIYVNTGGRLSMREFQSGISGHLQITSTGDDDGILPNQFSFLRDLVDGTNQMV